MGEWDWDWDIIIVFEKENGRLFHICSCSNEKTVSVFCVLFFVFFAFVVFVRVCVSGVEGGPTNPTGPYRLMSCCRGQNREGGSRGKCRVVETDSG